MREEQNEELLRRRFQELAERSFRQDRPLFTGFLSPAEAQWALTAGKKARVLTVLSGGYPDAERVIACFSPFPEEETPDFPIDALELRWPHQSAPAHRDILGSVMGLGLERHCIGDIVLEADRAILFCEHSMAEHLRDSLLSAGRIRLQTALLSELPQLSPPEGTEWRDTIASPRLDAVVASGCHLSRAKAADLINGGQVKLRHLPTLRTDAQVEPGDVISVRGFGRLQIQEIGSPTRKGRYPLQMLLFGDKRKP